MSNFQTDDIQIVISNHSAGSISVGLFDNHEDKRPIKVGSITIVSTRQDFFHCNGLILDKMYILHHYVDSSNFKATIYNFKPGVYLSELENVIIDPKTDKNKLILLDYSCIYVTISTAK